MNEPLFQTAFVTGLLLTPLVAVLGVYLRLRNEWLAALGYAQVAAAGGVASVLLPVAMLPMALAAATAAALLKGALRRSGNDHFALLILLGWGAAFLIAANHASGEMVGSALLDGQLYFTGSGHLTLTVVLATIALTALPWLSPRLLRERLFPDHFSANSLPTWWHTLPFDLLVVATIATATTAIGIMAAFALIFIPAWIAWHLARGWRQTLAIAAALATTAYLLAWWLALVLDQPFGPVIVALLVALTPLRLLPARATPQPISE